MRIGIFILLLLLLVKPSKSQKIWPKVCQLYERNTFTNDTIPFCEVIVHRNRYTFSFTTKFKSIDIDSNSSTGKDKSIRVSKYGPYIFKRKANSFRFKNLGRNRKFYILYSLSGKSALAPELFSSASDIYDTPTRLIDDTTTIISQATKVECYKFLQTIEGRFDKSFRLVYFQKSKIQLLRIEYFNDKRLKEFTREVFMK